ncbi:ATP-binding protein [Lichenihabitans sp. Uapishka_5]|uniref:hybrid sensor histidine kinase/response regulator n=1 Tax=Lichenihabitans sp. Uapishka_5 TaxID=3037302 RepID=UPI0029E80D76|nr:ATP-binding protein [Lichenihabitans sp. Uapishka_5]MDX7952219.1 ATP-binding protein [Lichenihabitans sp. Uapishka_5]
MSGRQRILPVRRAYNRWVANETLEDFALRFTAKSARRWSAPRVSQTALGAISFLALEAIGGAVTLSFGFTNVVWATLVVSAVLFVTGLPISRSAARAGVDIDLLTRGAGFGYIGSTVTSLVYATFTFILFAIEASIMAGALKLVFGLPLAWGYLLSAVAVIPLVAYGIAWISRFQILTQPLWIILNVLPIGFIAAENWPSVVAWTRFPGLGAGATGGFDLLGFGGAASVILALMPQIGEQVDVLRFLPARPPGRAWRWAASLAAAGPGWIVLGAPKLLFGSLLATLCLKAGVAPGHAAEPAEMYRLAFAAVIPWPTGVALLTAGFVVVSQLKINVMNAYAGSLAWSNFFSRVTHSHPGRVVWLVFNVAVALLLMELGIYAALERILSLFAVVAVAWLGAVVADLAINKPLGLSPPGIEFKRAHLYDINPVGTGAMALATGVALMAAAGLFGAAASALAPFVALGVALVAAPAIAVATKGRFYLARKPRAAWLERATITCSICDNPFEPEDMAYCPAYAAPICSLCCSLDARCHDLCKPHARAAPQVAAALTAVLPRRWAVRAGSPTVRYIGVFVPLVAVIGLALAVIHVHAASQEGSLIRGVVDQTLWASFAVLVIVSGVLAWFFVLSAESRRVAQEESARQTTALLQEIAAHRRTDAALQKAKEVAEAANLAKSRYVVGLSHEFRTPLNAVLGYAQLLERDEAASTRRNGVRVIRRSAEHLSGLIDGLLDVSKIEAGRLQIQRNEVRTAEFFAGVADMFRLQAAAKTLDFRLEVSPALPAVVATDEKRLRQILINLLSNAVKFTAAGHVALTVRYRNQVATLSVADTGMGIAADDIERIFEPFDRGALGTAEAVPGLGLGLTITKLLTELMGGALGVSSVPGQGSRFEARLMLAAVSTPQARLARNLQGYAGPRRTLLVVDDDGDHQALMRALLEPLGFSVLSARDGPTALALTADLRPDLVLLDISMPGMTGWEVAEALRSLRDVAAPIVMLSANVGDGAPQPPGDRRVHDAMLAKPFVLPTLLDTLERLLDLRWIEAPAPGTTPGAAPKTQGSRLAPDVLADLRHLGSIGHVRGIEARLDVLDRDAALRDLAATLRLRLRAFDFPGFEAILAGLDP